MDIDFGPCCNCGKGREDGVEARNIITLPFKDPTGVGWGCGLCGLPPHGAMSALCDDCMPAFVETGTVKMIVKGTSYKERIPMPEEKDREEFVHDRAFHQMDAIAGKYGIPRFLRPSSRN
jgi:hypothetical protein